MFKNFFNGILLFKIALVLTKEAELPLCPTNVLYFPQNLPMHCRMPTNADFPGISGSLGTVPPLFQSPPSDKHPLPISIPIPPGIPGSIPIPGPIAMPGPMVMPGSMGMPNSMGMPGPIAISGPPGPIPYPGAMPLPSGPAHKLPVIVMPFYSPDPSFKKAERPDHLQHFPTPKKWKIRHRRRRPQSYSPPDISSNTDMESSADTSSSSSSEYQGWWKNRRNHRRFNVPYKMKKKKYNQKRQLLTPVLQYVTKDGYVIFEKKITKTEAKDWMNVKKDEKVQGNTHVSEARDMESSDNHTDEREMITEDNVEVTTKRSSHKLKRIKAFGNKVARKKIIERPL